MQKHLNHICSRESPKAQSGGVINIIIMSKELFFKENAVIAMGADTILKTRESLKIQTSRKKNSKMQVKLIIICTAFVLFACSSKSLDSKFNKETYKADVEKLFEKKIITDEEKELLINYITVNETESLSLVQTYGEILSTAKEEDNKWKETKSVLDSSLSVQVIRKYVSGYYTQVLSIDISVQNRTEKEICAFKVAINFINSDGITFYSGSWNIPKTIAAYSKKTCYLSAGEIDNNNIEQTKLRMVDISKIQIEYDIRSLTYSDGTSLSLD